MNLAEYFWSFQGYVTALSFLAIMFCMCSVPQGSLCDTWGRGLVMALAVLGNNWTH